MNYLLAFSELYYSYVILFRQWSTFNFSVRGRLKWGEISPNGGKCWDAHSWNFQHSERSNFSKWDLLDQLFRGLKIISFFIKHTVDYQHEALIPWKIAAIYLKQYFHSWFNINFWQISKASLELMNFWF